MIEPNGTDNWHYPALSYLLVAFVFQAGFVVAFAFVALSIILRTKGDYYRSDSTKLSLSPYQQYNTTVQMMTLQTIFGHKQPRHVPELGLDPGTAEKWCVPLVQPPLSAGLFSHPRFVRPIDPIGLTIPAT